MSPEYWSAARGVAKGVSHADLIGDSRDDIEKQNDHIEKTNNYQDTKNDHQDERNIYTFCISREKTSHRHKTTTE